MSTKKDNWVACFESVLHDKSLSPTDLRVYLHIKFRHDYLKRQEKMYFESYETIQDATGISKRSIVSSMRLLQERGLIDVKRRSRQTSIIEVK